MKKKFSNKDDKKVKKVIDIFMWIILFLTIIGITLTGDIMKIPLWVIVLGAMSSIYCAITGSISLFKQIGDL